MKAIVFLSAVIAFLVLCTIYAPAVIEAGDRIITRTIVREPVAVRASSRRYERVYSADCSAAVRSGNCAGSFSSDCDVSRSSSCNGSFSVRRRSGVQVIIR